MCDNRADPDSAPRAERELGTIRSLSRSKPLILPDARVDIDVTALSNSDLHEVIAVIIAILILTALIPKLP